ncbi:MAG: hypothetical protein BWY09_00902 [Candidatus Hydrogenedentes bacterium ADurb.Bin179]|nr:MAG: hypothetical protein BWY09_00902 [Candidatus Hydrogenedentes bacterium ADurb.Bin179]
MFRRLASLHRLPSKTGSPASSVLSRRYDFLTSVSLLLVSLDSRYHTDSLSFLSRWTERIRGQPLGVGRPVTPARIHWGDGRTSQVPVRPPSYVCLVPATAVGSALPEHIQEANVVPTLSTMKTPTLMLSRLNSRAFGFAVYASQRRLPAHHARLVSGGWSCLTELACTHKVSKKDFAR